MKNLIGTFRYRPNWWAWVEVEYELGRYLRRLFLLSTGIKLQKPSWDEHVTVCSIHEAKNINKNLWWKYEGHNICFSMEINNGIYTNGNAYWYDVVSDDIDNIRSELGLQNPREIPLHFAIGYLTTGKIEL